VGDEGPQGSKTLKCRGLSEALLSSIPVAHQPLLYMPVLLARFCVNAQETNKLTYFKQCIE